MASIPNVPHDILTHSPEDCLQLALEAVKKSGLKPKGCDSVYFVVPLQKTSMFLEAPLVVVSKVFNLF
jgi:hypothetical protein